MPVSETGAKAGTPKPSAPHPTQPTQPGLVAASELALASPWLLMLGEWARAARPVQVAIVLVSRCQAGLQTLL